MSKRAYRRLKREKTKKDAAPILFSSFDQLFYLPGTPTDPQTLPNDVTPTMVYMHDTLLWYICTGPPESPCKQKRHEHTHTCNDSEQGFFPSLHYGLYRQAIRNRETRSINNSVRKEGKEKEAAIYMDSCNMNFAGVK